MQRLRLQLRGHPLRWIVAAALLAIAACVSLTPPNGGTGNIPVVTGGYKSGATQLVRIALDGGAPDSHLSATGEWAVFLPSSSSPAATFQSGQELIVSRNGGVLTLNPQSNLGTSAGQVIARAVSDGAFLTWNGKRYRGDLTISATDSGLLVVNQLPMDSYLRGVVPLEIGNRTAAEMAAVQAQAVAARTYAYKHLITTRAFDMYSTVQDQVYGGVDAEKPQSDDAISSTADVVVLYKGQPITTPYHSTCGGSTAAVSEVWYDQPDQPYLRPVSDRIPGTSHFYCDPSPRFSWTQSYDGAALRAVMEKYLATYTNAPKANLGKIVDVKTEGRTPSGRIAALTIRTESGSYTLKGNDIRFVLRDPKGTILNSTLFDYRASANRGEVSNLTINGRGYGHGLGMCQWGAIGRARAGQDYRRILETYYPGTTIGRIAG